MLLYAGQSEIKSMNCPALRKKTKEIKPLLLLPLVQIALRSAIVNEDLTYFSKDRDLADGYIYSHAILPLIEAVDSRAAGVIKHNMDFQFTATPMLDLRATMIGKFDVASTCPVPLHIEGYSITTLHLRYVSAYQF